MSIFLRKLLDTFLACNLRKKNVEQFWASSTKQSKPRVKASGGERRYLGVEIQNSRDQSSCLSPISSFLQHEYVTCYSGAELVEVWIYQYPMRCNLLLAQAVSAGVTEVYTQVCLAGRLGSTPYLSVCSFGVHKNIPTPACNRRRSIQNNGSIRFQQTILPHNITSLPEKLQNNYTKIRCSISLLFGRAPACCDLIRPPCSVELWCANRFNISFLAPGPVRVLSMDIHCVYFIVICHASQLNSLQATHWGEGVRVCRIHPIPDLSFFSLVVLLVYCCTVPREHLYTRGRSTPSYRILIQRVLYNNHNWSH